MNKRLLSFRKIRVIRVFQWHRLTLSVASNDLKWVKGPESINRVLRLTYFARPQSRHKRDPDLFQRTTVFPDRHLRVGRTG